MQAIHFGAQHRVILLRHGLKMVMQRIAALRHLLRDRLAVGAAPSGATARITPSRAALRVSIVPAVARASRWTVMFADHMQRSVEGRPPVATAPICL
ncbi:Uncharacterised protein [Sphingomonas paucimobilis]|nr:Uncharacterised protein [Sphingomonas paucimobilis]